MTTSNILDGVNEPNYLRQSSKKKEIITTLCGAGSVTQMQQLVQPCNPELDRFMTDLLYVGGCVHRGGRTSPEITRRLNQAARGWTVLRFFLAVQLRSGLGGQFFTRVFMGHAFQDWKPMS